MNQPRKARPLGRSGISAPPLAFGGNVFGWTVDEATSFRLLDRFVDAGFTLIDTADVYSKWVPGHVGGESETILGRWLARRGRRDDVIIATKVGGEMGEGAKGLSGPYIERAIDASLRRLQTDYVDLYQSHFEDLVAPADETFAAFARLIEKGKVRAIGTSNHSAARLKEMLAHSAAHGLPRYETLQPLYNLYDREQFERELRPICEAEHLGVIGYYSLASGFLTGKYRTEADVAASKRARSNQKYMNERGLRILAALDAVSARMQVKPAQIALAWVMAQPAVTAPIASATSLDQLEELIAAATLELDTTALAELDRASAT